MDLSLRFLPLKNTYSSGLYILATQDITKYKALITENAMLSKLPETNPDAVIIMDCPGKIRYINPAGKKIQYISSLDDYHKYIKFFL